MANLTESIQHGLKIGAYISIPSWGAAFGSVLSEGDEPQGSGYAGCQYRIVGAKTGNALPINIVISGRGYRYLSSGTWLKCQLVFVHDSALAGDHIEAWLCCDDRSLID